MIPTSVHWQTKIKLAMTLYRPHCIIETSRYIYTPICPFLGQQPITTQEMNKCIIECPNDHKISSFSEFWRAHFNSKLNLLHDWVLTHICHIQQFRHNWNLTQENFDIDKFISNVLQWTPTHGHTSVGRPVKTYINQLCANTGCYQVDLPCAMNNSVYFMFI